MKGARLRRAVLWLVYFSALSGLAAGQDSHDSSMSGMQMSGMQTGDMKMGQQEMEQQEGSTLPSPHAG